MRRITEKDKKKFETRFQELSNGEYSVLESYQGCQIPIKFRHNSDFCNGYIFKMRPHDFLKGQKCPYCTGHVKYTHQNYQINFNKVYKNDFILLSEWTSNKKNVFIKCKKCGNTISVNPKKALSDKIVCYCSQIFKDKNLILDELRKNKIQFKKDYYTESSKLFINSSLRFDFAIPLINGQYIMIDFINKAFYDEKIINPEIHKTIKIYDRLKQDYCNLNQNVFWLKIYYWNLDEIPNIITQVKKYLDRGVFSQNGFIMFRRSLKLRIRKHKN